MNKKRLKLFAFISASCLFSITLELFRIYYSSNYTYISLIWNLFLASIPLIFSTALLAYNKKLNSGLFTASLSLAWLLFFPNAPYIVTDLFNLHPIDNVPLWYDLGLMLSFSWNGLILGFISLSAIQIVMTQWFGKIYSWIIAIFSIVLASFGIYLGRFERLNSWDIFTNPLRTLAEIAERIINPMAHPGTVLFTILFSCVLILGYLTVRQLAGFGLLGNKK